ncbi:MAG: histidine--tRNA ligase [Candidatus Aenigmarchaeota archaeon]|nr:histidine--tRNA ligase [Candidatus Aenigmarchaeota archaeon]
MKFTLPKGMKDIAPDEMAKREYVVARLKDALRRFGFQLVEPSALENLETLTAKSGPDLEKEIYAFEDKAKRKIGLRFDLTVGMARYVASTDAPKPLRLACISNMWRYDNPQYARYRSFWQWDAEVYGCAGAEADAEIIALMIEAFKGLGLDAQIRINNRKLIEGFVLGIGIDKKRLAAVLRVIDKTAKLSKQQLIKEFAKCDVGKKQADAILTLCKGGATLESVKATMPKNELAQEGYKELEQLFALLGTYKIADRCTLDLSIVRGIDYYTGTVYEAWVDGKTGAVAGGGRYDDLLSIYGKPMPATGVAGGIERLLITLEAKKLLPATIAADQYFVAYATGDMFADAVNVVQALRKRCLPAIMDLSRRDLRKQMEYANKLNVRNVIIVGKKELEQGKLKLKDMASGSEREIRINLEELQALTQQ